MDTKTLAKYEARAAIIKAMSHPTRLFIVDQLSKKFDIIILDAPALLPVADTTLIAGLVDGVILVTRRAYSKEDKVREACRQLGEMDARMIGVVINGAEHNGTYYYHHSQN